MTEKEALKFYKQYEPLVNKIVKQFFNKIHIPWDELKSMGNEGLILATHNYDETRSNMTFLQYAAFSIRNNILTSLDRELRTVRMSNYQQKKAKETGDNTFTSVSLQVVSGENPTSSDDNYSREYKYGLYENNNYDKKSSYELFYNTIESHFPKREVEIFYMTFGLKNYDMYKGKEIALHFNLSEGSISQKNKKIIEFIKNNSELREAFSDFN